MSQEVKNRLKSLGWRVGMMVVAAGLGFAVENATELGIPPYGVVLLGLVLGEVSKWLNTRK